MDSTNRTGLQRFLRYRRAYEVGFLFVVLGVNLAANVATQVMELQREHQVATPWLLALRDGIGILVIVMLIPTLLAFDRRFPLTWTTLRRNIPPHLLASVVYSISVVVIMVALRKLVYAAVGMHYDFGDWRTGLLYEYLKLIRVYFGILIVIYCYRFVLLQLQGEVRLFTAPEVGPPVDAVERPERFLIRKLGKEFLVAAADIEWLEAQSNYVNLHVRGRAYPLRSTMTAIESRLDPALFVRVHRSYIVSLNHLSEIEAMESGDARLKLRDGSIVPCSRSFRSELRIRSAALPSSIGRSE